MDCSVSISLLSANMLNLEQELKKIKDSGADMIHYDVMDGVFVPNITFGMPILDVINKSTDLMLDVHLMIDEPLKYVGEFAKCGADIITFHLESKSNAMQTIIAIRNSKKKVAIAIKPSTPVKAVYDYLPFIDMVLVMTVEPGFAGQSFMHVCLDKIKALKTKIDSEKLDVDIQVDGGIDGETSALVREAGANILVSGSYLFNSPDISGAVRLLKGEINA